MSSAAPPFVPLPPIALPTGPETFAGQADSLFEVVDGRIVEKHVGALQISVAANLLYYLSHYVRQKKLGRAFHEMLYLLDKEKNQKRRPDASYVSYSRWPRSRAVPEAEGWDVVPELAVEVISPSNTADEVVTKIGEYFDAGCQRVWVVYPIPKQVYVYRSPILNDILTIGNELDGETAVPGFRMPVARLFDDESDE